MSPLRWTCKSTTRLAQELNRQGHQVSQRTVCDLLAQDPRRCSASGSRRAVPPHRQDGGAVSAPAPAGDLGGHEEEGTCVQRRLACSAGDSPAGVEVRSPVAWIASRRETEYLKPIDRPSVREGASHRAVTQVNADVASKFFIPKAEPPLFGRKQHGQPKSDRRG